jgi:hypothetical protein
MKDNHTTCSCNPGFVFFRDTCTATESEYLELSGALQLPQGEFSDAELKQILLDGFSAYLNFSKEFITIYINYNNDIGNGTSNATSRRRSLLSNSTGNSTVAFKYKAVMQVQKDDKTTIAKIQSISASNETISIEQNGHVITVTDAKVEQGYPSPDGKPLEECPKGRRRAFDWALKTLVCLLEEPNIDVKAEVGGSVGGFVGFVGIVFVIVYCCCCRNKKQKKVERQPSSIRLEVPPQQQPPAAEPPGFQNAMYPAKLLFPATVSFEYQLLPGQSI